MEVLLDSGRRLIPESLIWKNGSLSSMHFLEVTTETPRMSKLALSSPWEPARPQEKALILERIETPLLPLRTRPERILCPQVRINLVCGVRWVLTVDIHKVGAECRDTFERNLFLLSDMRSRNTFLLNHLCWGGSASATGILDPDVERKTHLRNTLRWNDMFLPCKKYLSMLSTISFKNDITWPIMRVARLSSTKTPITLPSVSNLSDLSDQVREGGQEGVVQRVLSRVSFRRSPVSVSSTVRGCLYISATSTSRRKTSPRDSFSLFVSLWFLMKLAWFLVTSKVLNDDIVVKTTFQYYWRSIYGFCLVYVTGPPTTVGTSIYAGQLGRRLWISQIIRLSAILEIKRAWYQSCHHEMSSRFCR